MFLEALTCRKSSIADCSVSLSSTELFDIAFLLLFESVFQSNKKWWMWSLDDTVLESVRFAGFGLLLGS